MEAMTSRPDNAVAVPQPAAIPTAFDDIDKAVAELDDAIAFAGDRVERLVSRIDGVLDPRITPMPVGEEVRGTPEVVAGYVASRLHDRAATIRHFADRVRSLGRFADNAGDRVEL